MEIVLTSNHKSIPSGLSFTVPDFCVLTGKNGSGKTHLLEAISRTADVLIDGNPARSILYIKLNQLSVSTDETFDPASISEHIQELLNNIRSSGIPPLGPNESVETMIKSLTQKITEEGGKFKLTRIIRDLVEATGKSPYSLNDKDVFKHAKISDLSSNTLLHSKLSLSFKTYFNRKILNSIAQLHSLETNTHQSSHLNPEDFATKYGPPPWDLVNNVLLRANLPYEFHSPKLSDFDLPFQLKLIDKFSGIEISVSELSSGEQVLMSLALAIYNTNEGGDFPDVLLLDEPDAPLHPQFSKLLIEILAEVIVKEAGIKVIMTTHSPSTVAMAPENSIFEIERSTKKPRMVKNSDALRTLTEGVDFLRISFESRRVIYVEHTNDVLYYSNLFSASSRLNKFNFEPVFVAPHTGTSNCTDVIHTVSQLRKAGNNAAWGIIDHDNKHISSDSIAVLGDGARYAIENYLLDPLYICFYLVRNHKKRKLCDFGVRDVQARYTDIQKLTKDECQSIVESILTKTSIPMNNLKLVKLENGMELSYPSEFLLRNGHQYENELKEIFPELNAFNGKGDSYLKLTVTETIIDHPEFLPVEIHQTFEKLLGPNT